MNFFILAILLYFILKNLDYVQFDWDNFALCYRIMPSFTRSIKFISVSLKSIKEKYLSSKLEKISIKNIYFKFDKKENISYLCISKYIK